MRIHQQGGALVNHTNYAKRLSLVVFLVESALLVSAGVVLAAKPVPTITITPNPASVGVRFLVEGDGFRRQRPTDAHIHGVTTPFEGYVRLIPSDKKGHWETAFVISNPGEYILFACQYKVKCGPAGSRTGQTNLTVLP